MIQSSLGLSSTNFVKRVNKVWVKSGKGLQLFLLGNHLTTTMINIFIDALLTMRKFHSLMERCVSWILLTNFLIWKNILIFEKFVMKKKYDLHVIIKLDDEADKWWEDTQIDRKRQGKHPIHSW